jgi:long-subunit fatty acid transport protein
MTIIMGILLVAALVFLVSYAAGAGYAMIATSSKHTKRSLRNMEAIVNKQDRALRAIANGQTDPIPEADLALSEVALLRDKELN